MNTIKYLSFISITFLMTMTSCQKQPQASFSTDKSEYIAGETIELTNTSTEGFSYEWTMPDGQKSSSENVEYTTSVYEDEGSLTFKLEAFSKNGKKTDETTETVDIKEATGNAVFWILTGSGYSATTVTLNGLSSNITYEYNSTPECGSAGCASFNSLRVGTYSWTASDGWYTWSGTITITKDACSKMQLN